MGRCGLCGEILASFLFVSLPHPARPRAFLAVPGRRARERPFSGFRGEGARGLAEAVVGRLARAGRGGLRRHVPTASPALLRAGDGGLRAEDKAGPPSRVGQRGVLHGAPRGALLLLFSSPSPPG